MAEHKSIEQRLATLEAEVSRLKRNRGPADASSGWLDTISGSMKDYPEFDEVVRLGRELRRAERPSDDDSDRHHVSP